MIADNGTKTYMCRHTIGLVPIEQESLIHLYQLTSNIVAVFDVLYALGRKKQPVYIEDGTVDGTEFKPAYFILAALVALLVLLLLAFWLFLHFRGYRCCASNEKELGNLITQQNQERNIRADGLQPVVSEQDTQASCLTLNRAVATLTNQQILRKELKNIRYLDF